MRRVAVVRLGRDVHDREPRGVQVGGHGEACRGRRRGTRRSPGRRGPIASSRPRGAVRCRSDRVHRAGRPRASPGRPGRVRVRRCRTCRTNRAGARARCPRARSRCRRGAARGRRRSPHRCPGRPRGHRRRRPATTRAVDEATTTSAATAWCGVDRDRRRWALRPSTGRRRSSLLRRLRDLGRDPVPDVLRGRDQLDVLGRPRDRGDPLQHGDLVAAPGAGRQVFGDVVRSHLVGDREHRQRLVVDVLHSITSRRVRSRARLRWMWLFTVPSGRSSRSAISRWLRSS